MESPTENVEFKSYKRKWGILALFTIICMCNGTQWSQYSVVGKVFAFYYNDADLYAIYWTNWIYFISTFFLILPATWLINLKGLQVAITLAMVLNCVGTWIRLLSIDPELFWVALLSQTLISISRVFVVSTPIVLAVTWFKPNQVASACAIGIAGFQLGNGLGILISDAVIHESVRKYEIEYEMSYLYWSTAIAHSIVLLLVFILFRSAPLTPPSKVEAEKSNLMEKKGIFHSIKSLLSNTKFVTLLTISGINQAVFYYTVFGMRYMGDSAEGIEEKYAVTLSATMVLSGALGAIVCGVIFDRTKKLQIFSFVIYAISALAMMVFCLLSSKIRRFNIIFLYINAGILGFSLVGYMPMAYRYATELVYPELEANSSAVFTMGSTFLTFVLGSIFVLFYQIEYYHPNYICWWMSGALIIGCIFLASIFVSINRARRV
ncbi:uncharacterized MFS-type transporter C09D4.1-like [Neocloeon triangulifer]|uniref:uncharacterized MFS-type transporter C09D4.1-like n=1 Tax=Neocloeon triangulifer TaxID=2078957 RepID=UPI00286EBA2E|nr:uncharacterized MFS-type transporter C09D4.1-like [Neocloeon triangulifer]